ncbi:hypothetical protein ONZ45_g14516 [Pleurotus djamor]|nr:hypothetical protein ONZ45_g14516 [Pleurotus djamor]
MISSLIIALGTSAYSASALTLLYPRADSSVLHPNGNTGKCLEVKGTSYANGSPVDINDCTGQANQMWALNAGTTQVQLVGTDWCLDAGSKPANGVHMKIWKCYQNLPAQTWFYTDDKRLAVKDKGQCLDLEGGKTSNGNFAQTWVCTDNNTNQVWTRGSTASSSSTSTSSAPSSTSTSRPAQLHLVEDKSKCITTANNLKKDGAPVVLGECSGPTPALAWSSTSGSTTIQFTDDNKSFCIDSGSDQPKNGDLLTIRGCDGSFGQKWTYDTSQSQFYQLVSGFKMCVDLTNANIVDGNQLQSFNCTDTNTNQAWAIVQ